MWQVVYIAKNNIQVKLIKQILETEGFLVDVVATSVKAQTTGVGNFEIRVLESEVLEAVEVLSANGY